MNDTRTFQQIMQSKAIAQQDNLSKAIQAILKKKEGSYINPVIKQVQKQVQKPAQKQLQKQVQKQVQKPEEKTDIPNVINEILTKQTLQQKVRKLSESFKLVNQYTHTLSTEERQDFIASMDDNDNLDSTEDVITTSQEGKTQGRSYSGRARGGFGSSSSRRSTPAPVAASAAFSGSGSGRGRGGSGSGRGGRGRGGGGGGGGRRGDSGLGHGGGGRDRDGHIDFYDVSTKRDPIGRDQKLRRFINQFNSGGPCGICSSFKMPEDGGDYGSIFGCLPNNEDRLSRIVGMEFATCFRKGFGFLQDWIVLIPSVKYDISKPAELYRLYALDLNIKAYLHLGVKEIIIFYYSNSHDLNGWLTRVKASTTIFNLPEEYQNKLKFICYSYYGFSPHIGCARMAIARYMFKIENTSVILSDDRRFIGAPNVQSLNRSLTEINRIVLSESYIISPAKKIFAGAPAFSEGYPTQIIFSTTDTLKSVYRNAQKYYFLPACFSRIMEDYSFATLVPPTVFTAYCNTICRITFQSLNSIARSLPRDSLLAKIFNEQGQLSLDNAIILADPNLHGKDWWVTRGYYRGQPLVTRIPMEYKEVGRPDASRATRHYIDASKGRYDNFRKYSLKSIPNTSIRLLQKYFGCDQNGISPPPIPGSSETRPNIDNPKTVERVQSYPSSFDPDEPGKYNPYTKKDLVNYVYKLVIPNLTQDEDPGHYPVEDRPIINYFNEERVFITEPFTMQELSNYSQTYTKTKIDKYNIENFNKPYLARLALHFSQQDNKSDDDLHQLVDHFKDCRKSKLKPDDCLSHEIGSLKALRSEAADVSDLHDMAAETTAKGGGGVPAAAAPAHRTKEELIADALSKIGQTLIQSSPNIGRIIAKPGQGTTQKLGQVIGQTDSYYLTYRIKDKKLKTEKIVERKKQQQNKSWKWQKGLVQQQQAKGEDVFKQTPR